MTSRKLDTVSNTPRRDLMKAVAAGAGLALLPGAAALARGVITPVRPSVSAAVAYLKAQAMVGTRQSGTAVNASGFVAASGVAAVPSRYCLRVLTASADAPLSLDAQYAGGAEHHFWQAWQEGSLLQQSSPSVIRWSALDGSALPLLVWYNGGSTLVSITARSGTYALTVADAARSTPDPSELRLAGPAVDGVALTANGRKLSIPYFVFAVRMLDA